MNLERTVETERWTRHHGTRKEPRTPQSTSLLHKQKGCSKIASPRLYFSILPQFF